MFVMLTKTLTWWIVFLVIFKVDVGCGILNTWSTPSHASIILCIWSICCFLVSKFPLQPTSCYCCCWFHVEFLNIWKFLKLIFKHNCSFTVSFYLNKPFYTWKCLFNKRKFLYNKCILFIIDSKVKLYVQFIARLSCILSHLFFYSYKIKQFNFKLELNFKKYIHY